MDDKLFEDEYFFRKRHVYSRFEAWVDLMQLMPCDISHRDLGKRWTWDKSKVRRFIEYLSEAHYITQTRQSATHLPTHLSLWKEKTKEVVPSQPPRQQPRQGLDAYSKTFLSFWAVYPRKVGKGAAWRRWKQIHPDNGLVKKILEAVRRQIQGKDWTRDHGQFIPHPETWLNQRRWEDETEPTGLEKFLW